MQTRYLFSSVIWAYIMFFWALPALAETIVDTAWVRRYNGPTNGGDRATALAVDDSGNVYVTGESWGTTSSDCATIKYSADGDTSWVRRYNGPENEGATPVAIALSRSGDVFVTGSFYVPPTDCFTIKYNASGDTAWVRRYNGPANSNDETYAIAVDDSDNAYVTGNSNNDCLTIKYFPNGDTAWVRRYDGGEGHDLAIDDSGYVYVTGYSANPGTQGDCITIKYKPNGETAWVRIYNGPTNYPDAGKALAVDSHGNVYVTGISVTPPGNSDYLTLKYGPSGNLLWVKTYDGEGNWVDEPEAIAIDDSGNVYVTGRSFGNQTSFDWATIKYFPDGDTVWVRRYNGPEDSTDYAHSLCVDKSGNVYVTGESWKPAGGRSTQSDYVTIKYDQTGNQVWLKEFDGPANDWDWPCAIVVDKPNNVYVTGVSEGLGTHGDYATIKYWQNYPPNSFSLLSPPDSSLIPHVVAFDWEAAVDPDSGDATRYDLYVSTSLAFHPDSTVIHDSLLISQYTDTLVIGRHYWKVRAFDNHSAERWSDETWSFDAFVRGDANADGIINLGDIVYLINFLFRSGAPPNPLDAGDANCDGYVTLGDIVHLINYLFKGGPPPSC